MRVLYSGDRYIGDIELIDEDKDGVRAPHAIDALTTTVKAAIIHADNSKILVGPVDCVSADAGASWGAGIVVFNFPPELTQGIQDGYGFVEIEVMLPDGPRTWKSRERLRTRKAHID